MRKKILISFTCLLVFTIMVLSSLFHYSYSIDHYKDEFRKSEMRLPFDAAVNASENVIGFFRDGKTLDQNFFNQKEADHLEDVKILLGKVNMAYLISLISFWVIIISMFVFDKQRFPEFLTNVCIFSGTLSIAAIVLLLVISAMDFDFMFLGFHKIFFTGNYAFDPAVSNMKAIYTDAFFMGTAAKIALMSIGKSILLLAAGLYIKRKIKR